MKLTILFFLFLGLLSCSSTKMLADENQEQNGGSIQVITAPIVEKPFYNKVGEKTGQTEYYIQRSTQDYFIKFCESNVARERLKLALSKIEGPIKTLTVKIEMREGDWDRCEDFPVQSRIGIYVVLHSIE